MQEHISTMNSTGILALSTYLNFIICFYTLKIFHFEVKLQSGQQLASYYYSNIGVQKISQIIKGHLPEAACIRVYNHKLTKLCLKGNLHSFVLTIWICKTTSELFLVILREHLIFSLSFYATLVFVAVSFSANFVLQLKQLYFLVLILLMPLLTAIVSPFSHHFARLNKLNTFR